MPNEEKVILVDENDNELGLMEKQEAHVRGVLHRAFSVFVFNSHGELLLQRRAAHKYHSGGLWTNTCCSHPRAGEETADAAQRRLFEEMGLRCPLTFSFSFVYKAGFDNGLTEHEFDHVFFGSADNDPHPDPEEVDGWKWMAPADVEKDLDLHPQQYTAWFKLVFHRVMVEMSKS